MLENPLLKHTQKRKQRKRNYFVRDFKNIPLPYKEEPRNPPETSLPIDINDTGEPNRNESFDRPAMGLEHDIPIPANHNEIDLQVEHNK